jgi:serine protease Do
VAIQPITADLARSFHLDVAEGALVADVTPGSPAARAGIARGDVIVRWGDHAVRQSRELPTLVAAAPPGSTVEVTLLRDGRERTVNVSVREMPAERTSAGPGAGRGEAPPPPSDWGIAVRPLSPAEARRRDLRAGTGVVVVNVEEGSPADEAGVEPDDVILQCNRQPVRTAADLRRALASNPRHALLLVRRETASIYIELER